jgi:hypothetical protein
MISVTILGRENQFLILRGQLTQRQPASSRGDVKLRAYGPYARAFGFGGHICSSSSRADGRRKQIVSSRALGFFRMTEYTTG